MVELVIADRMGFSLNDLYPLKFFRGREFRQAKSHVKAAAVNGVISNAKKVVICANAGGAYTSEVRLLLPIVDNIKLFCSDGFSVADKCYDSIEIIQRLVSL